MESGAHAGQELPQHVLVRRVGGKRGAQPALPQQSRMAQEDVAAGVYYIISLSGEKLAKEGSWDAVYGMWLSTFILTPIAIYLTYKATNDSALLDTDWYAGRLKALNERMQPAINKLKNAIKLKRNGKKHDSE